MGYTLRNILIAAVLAIIGVALTISYVTSQEQRLREGQSMVRVLVASQDIAAGTPASALEAEGLVETIEVPRESVVPQALSSIDESALSQPVDEVSVMAPIFQGQQITARSFSGQAGLNPADSIQGTQRLLAVPVGAFQSVAGQVRPGDRVDIGYAAEIKLEGAVDSTPIAAFAARNILVMQTPESLQARASTEAGTGGENASASVDDTPGIYMLQIPDDVVVDVIWAVAHSDNNQLIMALTPSSGATATNVPGRMSPPGLER